MHTLVFERFPSNDHNGFLKDCSITLIDKTDGSDPTRREEYRRRALKTVTPYGVEHDRLIVLFEQIRSFNTYFDMFMSSIYCLCL